MEHFVKTFWKEEDGNTTIDWMVLTAGLVLLGVALVTTLGPGTMSAADQTSTAIVENVQVNGV